MKDIDKEISYLPSVDVTSARKKVELIGRNIEKCYEEDIRNVVNLRKTRRDYLKVYLKQLEAYSTFSIYMIGPVIAHLFTLYKGEEYEFNYEIDWQNRTFEAYVKSKVNSKKKNIILSININDKKEICFYKMLPVSETIHMNPLLKRFSFVRKFVDFIVNYELANSVQINNESLISSIEYEFVFLNREEIEKINQELSSENKSGYERVIGLILKNNS